jgi:FG-GAP-like repeat/FG-GAP repeat
MRTTRSMVASAIALALLPAAAVEWAGAAPPAGRVSTFLDNPFSRGFEISFGQTISFAGDVDGDGYDELLAAAPYWRGPDSGGRVEMYPGSADGPEATPVELAAPVDTYGFGLELGAAGDVDADGYDDVVVGGHKATFLYYGSAEGLGPPLEMPLPETAFYVAAPTGVGDVDGDGYDDVVVGAGDWDGQFRNQGRIFVHLGSASGLEQSATEISGARRPGAQFGATVAPAGDVNGDGYDDVVVGAPHWGDADGPREGRGYVYLGSADGLRRPPWHVDPVDKRARFGANLSPAGDVDGDGYDDVVFGVGYPGRGIYVYFGSADGLTRPPLTRTVRGMNRMGFGTGVAGVGDLDGDGYDDIVVGAYEANVDRYSEGRTFTYLGTARGLTKNPLTRDPADRKNAEYGYAIAGGGDIDGDGSPDYAVSALEHPVENYRGRVYVYY